MMPNYLVIRKLAGDVIDKWKEESFISPDIEKEGEKFEIAHFDYETRIKRYQSLDVCL